MEQRILFHFDTQKEIIYMSRPTRKQTLLTLCIDLDQHKHAAQANPDRHFSSPVDFLFQESLLYTSIPLSRNVSVCISLRRFHFICDFLCI